MSAATWKRPSRNDEGYYRYPREAATLYGEPCTVAAWPAARPDQPERDQRESHEGEAIRPLRLADQSEVYLYVVFASGIVRCYSNGEEISESELFRLIHVTEYPRSHDMHFYSRFMADIVRQGLRGKSFFCGPCPNLKSSPHDYRWQSGTVDYPLCPAR